MTRDKLGLIMTRVTIGMCWLGLLLSAIALSWTSVLWLLALVGQMRVLELLKLRDLDAEMMASLIDEITALRALRNQQPTWSREWLEDTGEI